MCRLDSLLPQARSESFKIHSGLFEFAVDLFLFARRNVVPEVHETRNRLDNLKQDNLRLTIPVRKIFDVRADLFRTL